MHDFILKSREISYRPFAVVVLLLLMVASLAPLGTI